LIGAIGAGDLKLLTITALGFEHPEIFTLVTFTIAMVMSLFQMIRRKMFFERIRYLISYFKQFNESKQPNQYYSATITTEEKKKYSIHFSVPVFIAYFVLLIVR